MATMEPLSLEEHAAALKAALGQSQSNSNRLLGILSSFDQRLSTLESAMRPTQERTAIFRRAHENIEKVLSGADEVLAQYDVARQVEEQVRRGPQQDVDGYLDVISRLRSATTFFEQNLSFKSADAALAHNRGLLREAMSKMEGEFKQMLQQNTAPVDATKFLKVGHKATTSAEATAEESRRGGGEEGDEENDDEDDSDDENEKAAMAAAAEIQSALSIPLNLVPVAVPRMNELAAAMVKADDGRQCEALYRSVRGEMLNAALSRLGVVKMSREEVLRIKWAELEPKIEKWRKHMKLAVHIILLVEKRLCDEILKDLDPLREDVFADLSSVLVSHLFSFGEAVASGPKGPERLPALLDMFETMRDLMPQVNLVFASAACSSIRLKAQELLQRLAAAAKEAFNDFEEAVKKEDSKQTPADGSTHGLTSYVVNFIKLLYDYKATLQEIFNSDKMNEATIRIFTALLSNLEKKAELYRDVALQQIFLMNNVHYVVHAVKKSDLRVMLGDDWVHRHRRIVQQHASAYQRTAWNKVFALLKAQGLTSGPNDTKVSKTALKERFKTFNLTFEELHRTQCVWKIIDPELRSAVQLQVAEILLPAYRSFVTRYGPELEERSRFGGSRESSSKYIKFTEANLETLLNELFQGRETNNVLVAPQVASTKK